MHTTVKNALAACTNQGTISIPFNLGTQYLLTTSVVTPSLSTNLISVHDVARNYGNSQKKGRIFDTSCDKPCLIATARWSRNDNMYILKKPNRTHGPHVACCIPLKRDKHTMDPTEPKTTNVSTLNEATIVTTERPVTSQRAQQQHTLFTTR